MSRKSSAEKKQQKTRGSLSARKSGGSASVSVKTPGVANSIYLKSQMGMSDISDLEIGWLAGYVRIGDGVHGVASAVMADASGTGTAIAYDTAVTVPCPVPCCAPDVVWGESYLADVIKHYTRIRYKKILLALEPYGAGSNTAIAITVAIAPQRGGAFLFRSTNSAAATGAATGYLLGAKGSLEVPSFQRTIIDMTPYIANAVGGKEFLLNSSTTSLNNYNNVTDIANYVPCCFWVGGAPAPSSANGYAVMQMRFQATVDLLDFQGGLSSYLQFPYPAVRPTAKNSIDGCQVRRLEEPGSQADGRLAPPALVRQNGEYKSRDVPDDVRSLAGAPVAAIEADYVTVRRDAASDRAAGGPAKAPPRASDATDRPPSRKG